MCQFSGNDITISYVIINNIISTALYIMYLYAYVKHSELK
jgi:hypothetical protein